jgi:hypothetical protein
VTLVEKGTEVTPVDFEALPRSWLHAHIGTLDRGVCSHRGSNKSSKRYAGAIEMRSHIPRGEAIHFYQDFILKRRPCWFSS